MWTLCENDFTLSDSDIAQSYQQNIKMVAQRLQEMSNTSEGDTTVIEIVETASKLAVDCAKQRCRLRTVSYQSQQSALARNVVDRNGANYSTTTTETKNVENTVELFIAPGLQREGDNRGGNWNTSPTLLHKPDVFMKRIRYR
jgi:hypothetical protein